ncbi:methyltransferase [Clostridia bacterium]|nr:methyltransferase [Clostridia bacterium]
MAQSHYFINDDTVASDIKSYIFEYGGHSFTFRTDRGVFSRGKADGESSVLLDVMAEKLADKDSVNFLDLGCGYGFIGIVWKRLFPDCRVVMSDVNSRAVLLAKSNAALNKTDTQVILCGGIPETDEKYDVIALNPPIHAGKRVMYELYEQAARAVSENGGFYVVIAEKHGAGSTETELRRIFSEVTRVYKKKGIYVFKGVKR